jgi:hypothetical protein
MEKKTIASLFLLLVLHTGVWGTEVRSLLAGLTAASFVRCPNCSEPAEWTNVLRRLPL